MRKPDLTGMPQAGDAQPNTTGRYMVVFRDGALEKGIELLESLGLALAVSSESDASALKEDDAGDADVIVFRRLGVALVAGEPEQINLLAEAARDSSSPILAVEPEKIGRIIEDRESHPEAGRVLTSTLRRSAESPRGGCCPPTNLADDLTYSGRPTPGMDRRVSFALFDESQTTWGLQITNVVNSRFGGCGVRVAVLDTGIAVSVDAGGQVHYHPDFDGRNITAETFVQDTETAADGNGHGTHCLGTACGPLRPAKLPRYGIAYNADIYVGKVADDAGFFHDGWLLHGIEWAICAGCQIVSVSLGTKKEVGEPYSVVYETAALRALGAGTLIIAAAGNCYDLHPCPVMEPADCPSIMAVGAIVEDYTVASFSCIGINTNGGEVDIVAPGHQVYSTYLLPTGHTRASGTSTAAPHVAGIAALYAEANPGLVGKALWDLLIKPGNVYRLPFSPTYVGAGLVQSP